MSSVFFTAGAQNALTILRGIDKQIDRTQSAISSGRTVATAADNPSVFALTQDLAAQQASFLATNDGLSLGVATVSTASAAAEEINGLLSDIRAEIVNANAVGANTTSIQSKINDLSAQINALATSASFNGENLLVNNASSDASTFSTLAMVYETSSGSVGTNSISINTHDLTTTAQTIAGSAATATDYFADASEAISNGAPFNIDIAAGTVAYGVGYRVRLDGDAGSLTFGNDVDFEYVARAGDTNADVAAALHAQIDDYISANNLSSEITVALDASNGRITVTNHDVDDNFQFTGFAFTGGTAGGGLRQLSSIDVSTQTNRDLALAHVDTMIATVTAAEAALGAGESRLASQQSFLQNMNNVYATAINDLAGADLNTESARLAALEAQRALALEMVSISSRSAEGVLGLLRSIRV